MIFVTFVVDMASAYSVADFQIARRICAISDTEMVFLRAIYVRFCDSVAD